MLEDGLASRPVDRAVGVFRPSTPTMMVPRRSLGGGHQGHRWSCHHARPRRGLPERSGVLPRRDEGPCATSRTKGPAQGRARSRIRSCRLRHRAAAGTLRPELPLPGPADVVLADGRLGVIRRLAPRDGPASACAARRGLRRRAADALLQRVASGRPRLRGPRADRPGHAGAGRRGRGRLVALGDGRADSAPRHQSRSPSWSRTPTTARAWAPCSSSTCSPWPATAAIRRIEAEVLVENHAMLRVLADAGFELTQHPDRGVVMVNLHTTGNPQVQDAADRREFYAESRSLAPLLAPRSVAVAGVRSDGTRRGRGRAEVHRSNGYAGSVVVVHPETRERGRCSRVPVVRGRARPRGPRGDRRAGRGDRSRPRGRGRGRGTRGRRDQLRVRRAGSRWEGAPAGAVGAGADARDPAGGSQLPRGAGQRPRDPAERHVQRPAAPASRWSGDRQPVGWGRNRAAGPCPRARAGCPQLRVPRQHGRRVQQRPAGRVVRRSRASRAAALYLESFGNARKFARFARRFSERKPVLAVVGGPLDVRAARAAPLTPLPRPRRTSPSEALFAQSGVIGCADADDLAEAALLLTEQPLPAGPRLAVLSNAGGMGILVADAAEACRPGGARVHDRAAAIGWPVSSAAQRDDEPDRRRSRRGAGADGLAPSTPCCPRARSTPSSPWSSPPASPTASRSYAGWRRSARGIRTSPSCWCRSAAWTWGTLLA